MLPDFHQHPGYYFVAATLVPLASFVLLLLGSAAWAAARPYRDTDYGALLYNLFGGDRPGPTKAYVALGAIVIAFLLSFTGFIIFVHQHLPYYHTKHEIEALEAKVAGEKAAGKEEAAKEAEAELKELEKTWADQEDALHKAWSGRWDWLRVPPAGVADDRNGTNLEIGFRIDGLNAIMFAMVTFVASLIHLFSIG